MQAAENQTALVMAEVLSPNAESKLQRTEENEAGRLARSTRAVSFKYYIHDSVATLRFELMGDLRAPHVAELHGSWETARTTLNLRRFVLDVSQLYSADEEGRSWLRRMNDAGAVFHPALHVEKAAMGKVGQAARADVPEQVESVRLSLLGRVLGRFRGVRGR